MRPDEQAQHRLDLMRKEDVVGRIWRGDHTIWKPSPAEIADRLGWLRLPESMRSSLEDLTAFAGAARADGFTHAVLLGMGGSSLAAEVMRTVLGVRAGSLDLVVLDTTHPAAVASVAERLALDTTLFLVASKSGETIETLSHFRYFWSRGPDGARFVAVTDPGSPLEALAREHGFRRTFLNPPDVGGRYSALSLFGLVPASLIGADVARLLGGGEEMAAACRRMPAENPGAALGAQIGEAALAGRDKLTIAAREDAGSFGAWVAQLVAESTGKEGKGIVPVDGEDIGAPEVYSADRFLVAIGDVRGIPTLERAGHPVVRQGIAGAASLGAQFFLWEFATAVAGHVLGINPFDQPNVAEAKRATAEVLAAGPGGAPALDDPSVVLDSVRPGDYVAIQAFLEPSAGIAARLQRARMAIRDRTACATTVGFGPRYLHSTGQLHKGGPDTGVFLQVVDTAREADVEIPGAGYTFGRLIDAQATGDLRALRARGRRATRTTLEALEEAAGTS